MARVAVPSTPEACLGKASRARSPATRARHALEGLAQPSAADETTRWLLLRQLYLAHMEARRFESAADTAREMVALGVMPDVARQDLARAALALGDVPGGVAQLRLAGRVGPASRRAFHAWTLGTTLLLSGRPAEAVEAFERAVRWSTADRPLHAAELALARVEAGDRRPQRLEELLAALEDAPCGQGYGQYVRGRLAYQLGDLPEARRLLRAFVRRVSGGRVALAVALQREVERARDLLAALERDFVSRDPRGS